MVVKMLNKQQVMLIILLTISNLPALNLGILNLIFLMLYLGQLGIVSVGYKFGYFQSKQAKNAALIPCSNAFFKLLRKLHENN